MFPVASRWVPTTIPGFSLWFLLWICSSISPCLHAFHFAFHYSYSRAFTLKFPLTFPEHSLFMFPMRLLVCYTVRSLCIPSCISSCALQRFLCVLLCVSVFHYTQLRAFPHGFPVGFFLGSLRVPACVWSPFTAWVPCVYPLQLFAHALPDAFPVLFLRFPRISPWVGIPPWVPQRVPVFPLAFLVSSVLSVSRCIPLYATLFLCPVILSTSRSHCCCNLISWY